MFFSSFWFPFLLSTVFLFEDWLEALKSVFLSNYKETPLYGSKSPPSWFSLYTRVVRSLILFPLPNSNRLPFQSHLAIQPTPTSSFSSCFSFGKSSPARSWSFSFGTWLPLVRVPSVFRLPPWILTLPVNNSSITPPEKPRLVSPLSLRIISPKCTAPLAYSPTTLDMNPMKISPPPAASAWPLPLVISITVEWNFLLTPPRLLLFPKILLDPVNFITKLKILLSLLQKEKIIFLDTPLTVPTTLFFLLLPIQLPPQPDRIFILEQ